MAKTALRLDKLNKSVLSKRDKKAGKGGKIVKTKTPDI